MLELVNKASSVKVIRSEAGKRTLEVRGKFGGEDGAPIQFRVGNTGVRLRAPAAPAGTEPTEPSTASDLLVQIRAKVGNRAVSPDDVPNTGIAVIEGIASSTGRDSYGTEMSRACLDSQAAQYRKPGVAYAPTHWEREWHDVIGLTTDAIVLPTETVADAADPSEKQYLCRVTAEINLHKVRSRELVAALANNEQVGQSIGAWFTVVRWEEDEAGNVTRVIIDDVLMDHLAATRTPANPESDDLHVVRSAIAAEIRSMCPRAAQGAPPVGIQAAANAGHVTVPNRRPIPTVTDRAAYGQALRSGAGRPEGLTGTGVAVLAEVMERGLKARHVLAIEDAGASWAVSFAKDDEYETESADAPRMPARYQDDDVAARHVVSISEDDDRVVIYFAKLEAEDDDGDDGAKTNAAPAAPTPDDNRGEEAPPVEPDPARSEPDPLPDPVSESDPAPATEPHRDEEGAMTPEQIAELAKQLGAALSASLGASIGDAVGTALRAQAANPPARAADPAATPNPAVLPPPAAERASAPAPGSLEARLAALEAESQRDKAVIAQLMAQPVRATGGPALFEDAADEAAWRDGDLTPLVVRAKSENIRPILCRAVETAPAIRAVLAARENPKAEPTTKKGLEACLSTIFRAYAQDGGFKPTRQAWA